MFKKFYLSNAAIALSLCAALQLNGAENNATSANISAPSAEVVNSAASKNASGANATKLGTIVVTATGFEDTLKNEVRNVSVITAEDMENRGYRDLREILEKAPGVSFNGRSVDLRGQGAKANTSVKVLLNGVALNMIDTTPTSIPIDLVPIEDIERVEITAVENMGIESRGGFYDQTGALRDMVQNHLAQLVALSAMEPPVQFNADLFRNEVVKVYQSFRPMTPEEIRRRVVRGQYTESEWKGEHQRAYREEDKIASDSRTETFVAMKLYIDNWRWQGVPFYIRTGKMMPTKVTEIVIHFKPTPHRVFATADGSTVPNQLVIRIQPNEGISLKFAAKVPGSGFEVKKVSMDFTYDQQMGGLASGDAYSRLLEDCMLGDPTLFTRSDAVEMSWRFFDPILDLWKEEDFPLYGYPAGTWGPKQSDLIIEREHSWTNPCRNLTHSELYCEL